MPRRRSFFQILRDAIRDFRRNGFENAQQLQFWVEQLSQALDQYSMSDTEIDMMLRQTFGNIYTRLIKKGGIFRLHDKEIPRWQIERLTVQMRQVLDEKIMAAANLIKLDKRQMKARTLARFQGWATSIPKGGAPIRDKSRIENIRKSADVKYQVRRVMNDQGHKLIAAINEVVATGNNAIAVEWNSHWRRPGYQYREEHKDRDEKIYAIKGNWAIEQGLMKKGPNPYYDDITHFGEEVNCTCYGSWIYSIADLPEEMLTQKGKDSIAQREHLRRA